MTSQQQAVVKTNLTLEDRNSLVLTGVKKVKAAEPHLVTVIIEGGGVLIAGEGLAVDFIDVKEGLLKTSGRVDSIKYTGSVSRGFSVRNMFK